MVLWMVETTKSQIWFCGSEVTLNHPKSSSRKPRGPNCNEQEEAVEGDEEEEEVEEDEEEEEKERERNFPIKLTLRL